jgi:hypothetical protein
MVAQAVRGLTGAERGKNEVGRSAMRAVLQVQAVGPVAETAQAERDEAQADVLLRNGWSNMRCVSTLMATESSAAPNC